MSRVGLCCARPGLLGEFGTGSEFAQCLCFPRGDDRVACTEALGDLAVSSVLPRVLARVTGPDTLGVFGTGSFLPRGEELVAVLERLGAFVFCLPLAEDRGAAAGAESPGCLGAGFSLSRVEARTPKLLPLGETGTSSGFARPSTRVVGLGTLGVFGTSSDFAQACTRVPGPESIGCSCALSVESSSTARGGDIAGRV